MNLAWYISIGLHLALLLRLLNLGAWRNYRALVVYLAAAVCRSLTLVWFSPYTLRYFYIWTVTEPILLLASAAVAVEVYRSLCSHYRGIEQISKFLFAASLAVAAVAATAPLFFEQQFLHASGLVLLKTMMFVAMRFIYSALAAFTASIIIFTLLHPETIRRNVRWYAVMAALYFMRNAAQALTATSSHTVLANTLVLPLSAALMAVWLCFMRSAGEKLEPRHPFANRGAIDEFDRQLLGAVRNLRP